MILKERKHLVTPRRAAVAGMGGPVLVGTDLVALSVAQYDFMIGIGWEPAEPGRAGWPSALTAGRRV